LASASDGAAAVYRRLDLGDGPVLTYMRRECKYLREECGTRLSLASPHCKYLREEQNNVVYTFHRKAVFRIRIRCLFDPGNRDPGWVTIKIRIRDPDRDLETNFWLKLLVYFMVKILKFFDADADPGSENIFGPGSGIKKIRIRDPG
jgi:hypothetical protein